jgi:hypothetical protein
MTHAETMRAVVSAIMRIQERSGNKAPELHSDTVVIKGVEGFDSLRGLELSVAMSRFFDIPDDVNVCVSDCGKRPLTVGEITAKLMAMTQKSRVKE